MSTKVIDCYRIEHSSVSDKVTKDNVVDEKPFTIQIDQVGSFTLLATPRDLQELAVGFLFTEGVIESFSDILKISVDKLDQSIISFSVKNPHRVKSKRNLIVTSGCGMCGKDNIDNILFEIKPCKERLKINPKDFVRIAEKVREKQKLFQQTGATHAAAIFDARAEIIACFEDIGRHNALDKAIGKCLIDNKIDLTRNVDINIDVVDSTTGLGVFLSSRVSFEMVTKAARAGIELIVAVSAPSSLAVKAAEYWNITLCGFVRDDKGNVYSGVARLIF